MIVRMVLGERSATIVDPDDLKTFHLEASPGLSVREFQDILGAMGATPDSESFGYCWIPIEWVRGQACDLQLGSPWLDRFESMLDYARSKGWLRGDRIRAHVVWQPVAASSRGAFDGHLDTADFTALFRGFPAGVAVLTADVGAGPVGLTATSVMSASAAPPVLAFSISDLSSSTPTLAAADTVVVHLLAASDMDIAVLCSTSGIDRFADHRLWGRLPTGEPYFPTAHHWIRARPFARMGAGTATVVAALALQAGGSAGGSTLENPLVYHGRQWHGVSEASKLSR